jgi:hypothetical protein
MSSWDADLYRLSADGTTARSSLRIVSASTTFGSTVTATGSTWSTVNNGSPAADDILVLVIRSAQNGGHTAGSFQVNVNPTYATNAALFPPGTAVAGVASATGTGYNVKKGFVYEADITGTSGSLPTSAGSEGQFYTYNFNTNLGLGPGLAQYRATTVDGGGSFNGGITMLTPGSGGDIFIARAYIYIATGATNSFVIGDVRVWNDGTNHLRMSGLLIDMGSRLLRWGYVEPSSTSGEDVYASQQLPLDTWIRVEAQMNTATPTVKAYWGANLHGSTPDIDWTLGTVSNVPNITDGTWSQTDGPLGFGTPNGYTTFYLDQLATGSAFPLIGEGAAGTNAPAVTATATAQVQATNRSVKASATTAAATGSITNPTAKTGRDAAAVTATATGAGQNVTAKTSPTEQAATATALVQATNRNVKPSASTATATGSITNPTVTRAGRPTPTAATAAGAGQNTASKVSPTMQAATATALAINADTTEATGSASPVAITATATGTAPTPSGNIKASAQAATATGSITNPTVTRTGRPTPTTATATAAGQAPTRSIKASTAAATASALALLADATEGGGTANAAAITATATATADNASTAISKTAGTATATVTLYVPGTTEDSQGVPNDPYGVAALSLSPVAYWPLDDPGVWADLAGNNFSLAASGTVAGATLSNGMPGADFSGTTYLYRNDAAALRPEGMAAGWSVSMWVERDVDDISPTSFFGKYEVIGGPDCGISIGFWDTPDFQVNVRYGSGSGSVDSTSNPHDRDQDSTSPTSINTPYHVVWTFDYPAGVSIIYIDGVEHSVANGDLDHYGNPLPFVWGTTSNTSAQPVTIGASLLHASGDWLDGKIAKVAYYDYPLTAEQVTTLNQGITGPYAPTPTLGNDPIYEVYAADRGGYPLLGRLTPLSQLRWERTRDEMSGATVDILKPDQTCMTILQTLRAARHEVVVFRNGERVWEGPITRIEYGKEYVQIDAKDVLWYASRTALNPGFDHRTAIANAITVLSDVLEDCYGTALSDPRGLNVGKWLTPVYGDDDPKTARFQPAYSQTVYEMMESFAEDSGVDYVVVGRRILWFDTHLRGHVLPPMSDKHFLAGLIVTEYGSEMATRVIMTDGQGSASIEVAPTEWTNYYGLMDKVITTTNEDTQGQAVEVTEREGGRYPAPLRVRVPDGTGLSPDAPVTIQQLIPGAAIPLRSEGTCRDVEGWQKLDAIQVSWTPEGETVAVTMSSGLATVANPV